MNFIEMKEEYIDQAVELAVLEYEEECKKNSQLMKADFHEVLREEITFLFQQKYGKLAIDNGELVGYLAFLGPWDGFFGLTKGVYSPLGGSAFSGEDRNQLASRLFEEVGNDLVKGEVCSYALSLYAHDEEVGRSFVMNGFGIRCSDGIMRLAERTKCEWQSQTQYTFEELAHEDKRQIDHLRRGLTMHLCKSPVFFPTDLEQIDDWYERKNIRVFVAKHGEKVIGFLSIMDEGETFMTGETNITNICGAYVETEYRGAGVADMLLEYLCETCERDGFDYLGVDCETLNPTALRYWRKHFDNYTYSYARRIDERVVGYETYLTK